MDETKTSVDALRMTRRVVEANRIYFDAIAGYYDDDPAQRRGCYHGNGKWRYREFLLPRVSCGEILPGKVVNIGCGSGHMMDAEDDFLLRSIGLDVSWRMLERARRVSRRLIQGDAHALPFPDSSMTLASCIVFLHHVYDPLCFFRECFRVLRPFGWLYADYDPNYYAAVRLQRHWLLRGLWRRWRKVSFDCMGVGTSVSIEVACIADYHNEIEPGFRPEELARALSEAGFWHIAVIPHSDGPSLLFPKRGKFARKLLEWLLIPFGAWTYGKRAKNIAVLAQKPPETRA